MSGVRVEPTPPEQGVASAHRTVRVRVSGKVALSTNQCGVEARHLLATPKNHDGEIYPGCYSVDARIYYQLTALTFRTFV